MPPLHRGLLLGTLGGTVPYVLTGDAPWMAAGVLLGLSIGAIVQGGQSTQDYTRQRLQRDINRNAPRHPLPTTPRAPAAARVVPEVEKTAERRAVRLTDAADRHGTLVLQAAVNRTEAIDRMRLSVPDFPDERYAAELDEALTRIEPRMSSVRARRSELVEEARGLDCLNAVFTLRYFNGRFSRHVGQYGLGPIDIHGALGDLYLREMLDEAVCRADALIDEGIGMGTGSWDHGPNSDYLRQAHPGFSDRALGEALDWGHLMYR